MMEKFLSAMLLSIIVVACGHKTNYDPYNVAQNYFTTSENKNYFEVNFKSVQRLKYVHVKLNDAVGKDAIFDTGCSDMLISKLEYVDLIKEGKISENDYCGHEPSYLADGEIGEYETYRLHEVSVTDNNGETHSVYNVIVTVVPNLKADILIGSTIIDQLATHSYTVDLENNLIRFQ